MKFTSLLTVAGLTAGCLAAPAPIGERRRDEAAAFPPELPTGFPTDLPFPIPTELPTDLPFPIPTELPTDLPFPIPTELPTDLPFPIPTGLPTEFPIPTGFPASPDNPGSD